MVVGFTRPKGSRAGFGALHLAMYQGKDLVYVGPGRDRLRRGAARGVRGGARGIRDREAGVRRRGPRGQGARVGRAAARGGGAVPGMESGRAPQAAGVLAVPERQEAGGVCEAGCGGCRGSGVAEEPPSPPPYTRHPTPCISIHQPPQGLLAGRGLHQGRPRRLLQGDLAVAAPLPQGPAAGAHALSGRHRGQVVLPEGRAGLRARFRAHRARVQRGLAARDELLRVRRRVVAALHREHGRDPAAHLGQPGGDARDAGLVHPRPRSQGRAVRGTW